MMSVFLVTFVPTLRPLMRHPVGIACFKARCAAPILQDGDGNINRMPLTPTQKAEEAWERVADFTALVAQAIELAEIKALLKSMNK